MKRLLALVLPLLLVSISPVALGEGALPEKVEMYYFYDTLCGSCDGTEAFDAAAEEALSGVRDLYPYDIYRVNVYTGEGRARYQALCEAMGLDEDMLSLPVLMAGGRVFQGDETIAKNLREAYLVAGEDLFVNGQVYNPAHKKTGTALFEDFQANPNAVTVVYFYRITCEECVQTAPVIDGLPDAAEVIRINTRSGNNGERVAAFFEAYGVPDEDRMVPIAFTSDAYFAGFDAISGGLPAAVEDGEAGFVFPGVE